MVLLSSPLQESGSVQRVIEEDAGLLVVLASDAWHRGQRKVPLRFSHSPGGAIRGRDVLWEENHNAVPINVPLKEGRLVHLMLLVVRMVEVPLPTAVEGSRSRLPVARILHRSLNCSKGYVCLLIFWRWCQARSTQLLLNPSWKNFYQDRRADERKWSA